MQRWIWGLFLLGCGGVQPASELHHDAQLELCKEIAHQSSGAFACHNADLQISHATADEMRYAAEVEFRPSGSVEKFRNLHHVVPLTTERQPAPDCMVNSLRRLKLSARETGIMISVELTYRHGAVPVAAIKGNRVCAITQPPLP